MSVPENELGIGEITVTYYLERLLCVAYVNGVTSCTFCYIGYIYILGFTLEGKSMLTLDGFDQLHHLSIKPWECINLTKYRILTSPST